MCERAERYLFIDALRGIAALAVLFHHLLHNTVLEVTLRKILPRWVQLISHHGALGVEIFFVISGFVIAYSLRATAMTPRALGNFIVRRQLRLDPPYWAAVIFILLLAFCEARTPGLVRDPLPTCRTVFINLFYLQNMTGTRELLNVAWTLCLEIQFYLVFILILSAGGLLGGKGCRGIGTGTVAIMLGSGLLFLAIAKGQHAHGAWFLPFWMYFVGGCLCCWSLTRRINDWFFITFAAAFCVLAVIVKLSAMNAGFVTILGIYAVGKLGHLSDWLGGAVPQFFGRISYSLYLVHLPVLSVIMRGGYKLTNTNTIAAIGWMFLAAVCSVVCAQAMYVLVEKPSMRFASKFKTRAEQPQPSKAVDVVAGSTESTLQSVSL